jgi:hypothetical protein
VSLFVIADLHLSFGSDKPMEIFPGWERYIERLTENWNRTVSANDTVVIAGDTSWAASLENALPDFDFINNTLHGEKIIIKGNHDYWWTSLTKMNAFIAANNLGNINFLHNNAFLVDNTAVCGTRGWFAEGDEKRSEKLQKREAGRLEASVRRATETGGELCAFLHYPPVYGGFEDYYIIDVLQRHKIRRCYYGHLHGAHTKNAVLGRRYGTELCLVSADFVGFTPVKVEN